jgi:hypothetical protein
MASRTAIASATTSAAWSGEAQDTLLRVLQVLEQLGLHLVLTGEAMRPAATLHW